MFIPVNTPDLSGNELRYVTDCIQSGWISSEGPYVRRFEEEFARRVDRKHGIAVSNGSAALDVSIVALGIGPGDEVIIPTFTIISCASAVVRAGATPVLVDAGPTTWNMDIDAVESRITSKTRAIMVVHIYNLPVDMDPILGLAKKYDLKIIEDAAEMHGQTYNGRPCGSFGDISTFSFYPNKHVTTGEGGMVLTDDPIIAARLRSLRDLCFDNNQRFVHHDLGWNLRMTNLQAALGVAQLERLDQFVNRKRQMGSKYNELFSASDALVLPPRKASYADSIYWVYGLLLAEHVKIDGRAMVKMLGERGVGARPFFWPMHEQPVFRKYGWYQNERYPEAERLGRRGFYIPSGLGLQDGEQEMVAQTVLGILRELEV